MAMIQRRSFIEEPVYADRRYLFIVYGCKPSNPDDEYDEPEWSIVAYFDEAEAHQHCAKLQTWCAEHRHLIQPMQNPFDKEVLVSPAVVNYGIHAVEIHVSFSEWVNVVIDGEEYIST